LPPLITVSHNSSSIIPCIFVSIPEVMSTVDHEESESAIQKSSGKYYLNVNASGKWSVVVEEEQ